MTVAPLTRLFMAIEELRKLESDMPIHTASIFLMVAREPGASQISIRERSGMSKTTLSRVFDDLSDRPAGITKPAGMGLICINESIDDRRYKVTKLTPKGARVVASLEHLIGGS